MYDLVHRSFQKLIGVWAVSTLIVLGSCASPPSAEHRPERGSRETAEVAPSVERPSSESGQRSAEDRSPEERPAQERAPHESPDSQDSVELVDPADPTDPTTQEERPPRVEPEPPELTEDAAIENLLIGMTLRQRIGQMIMPALIYDSRGDPVRGMNEDLFAVIEEIEPGGFVLFGPNIVTAEQVRSLVRSMHAVSRVPLTIAVDQEGGIVRRVVPREGMPATEIPSARAVGRLGDPALAYELGRVIGRELRSLGITMNFAPVADVQTNPENPVIGSRSYGSDPHRVGEMVAATVRGLQTEGVSAVVKHFPGHGDTFQDSHDEAATVAHDLERLQLVELVPFRRGIEAGADGVMIGHIAVPQVTGSSVPATLDAVLVEGLLRERLGFQRVVVTDSLVMEGLTRYFEADTIAVRAVQAGADILLLPGDPAGAVTAIEAAVEAGEITRERIDRSVRRILRTKMTRELLVVSQEANRAVAAEDFMPPEVIMGTDEHRTLVEVIRQGEQR